MLQHLLLDHGGALALAPSRARFTAFQAGA